MRLFPSDYQRHSQNASHNDQRPPADNNPGNDTVRDGVGTERVAGVVFPYRGMEQHGVPADQDPWQRAGIDDASTDDSSVYDERYVPDPVPVYIVNRYAHEIKTWNTQQIDVGINPREIAGRNLARTRLRIKNLHPSVVVYIGRANMANYLGGFPLDPNTSLEMNITDELWAVSADLAATAPPILAVLQEFTINGEEDGRWH